MKYVLFSKWVENSPVLNGVCAHDNSTHLGYGSNEVQVFDSEHGLSFQITLNQMQQGLKSGMKWFISC